MLCGLFSRGMSTQQGYQLNNEEVHEANPFIGAKDTRDELLWKVTPVYCYIELS